MMRPNMKRWESGWRRQCFRYHPTFGWWHIENLQARLMLGRDFHDFRTNSDGLRASRDYDRSVPNGRFRFVALGDSYTAGDGVSNSARASDLLEQRFQNLEVMNFGLNGSGTDQQLLIYEELASQWQADAYIWFFCVENIARNKYTCFPSYNMREHKTVLRPKPYFELSDDVLALRNVPVPREMRSYENRGDWSYTFPYLQDHPTDPYAIYRDPQSAHWLLMKAIIQRFLRQVAPKPVLLVPLPMHEHYMEVVPPGYMERFLELQAPAENVHVIDVLPVLLDYPKSERYLYRFPDDPHYTAFAHRKIADVLEYEIQRLQSQILGAAATKVVRA
jgi:hypothetical protein